MHRLRPIFALFLVLAIALGGASFAPQAGAAVQAGDIAAGVHDGMASIDPAMPCECGGCVKDEMAKPACLPVCTNVQVVLPEYVTMRVPATRATRGPSAEERVSDSFVRPDPYPPKLILNA